MEGEREEGREGVNKLNRLPLGVGVQQSDMIARPTTRKDTVFEGQTTTELMRDERLL